MKVVSGAMVGVTTSSVPLAASVPGICALYIARIYGILTSGYTPQQLHLAFPKPWAAAGRPHMPDKTLFPK